MSSWCSFSRYGGVDTAHPHRYFDRHQKQWWIMALTVLHEQVLLGAPLPSLTINFLGQKATISRGLWLEKLRFLQVHDGDPPEKSPLKLPSTEVFESTRFVHIWEFLGDVLKPRCPRLYFLFTRNVWWKGPCISAACGITNSPPIGAQ